MKFIVRLLASAVALGAAAWLVDGIVLEDGSRTEQAVTLIVVALIFGVLNAVVRPLLSLLSLPLILLTLGLFLVVINALMLLLVSWVSGWFGLAFEVQGFWPALLGAIVVSVVSFLIDVVLPDEYER